MPANSNEIEKRLWDAADELRANSRLKASEYSVPVLGLIFLRYADHKFAQADQEIKAERAVTAGRRQRPITRTTTTPGASSSCPTRPASSTW